MHMMRELVQGGSGAVVHERCGSSDCLLRNRVGQATPGEQPSVLAITTGPPKSWRVSYSSDVLSCTKAARNAMSIRADLLVNGCRATQYVSRLDHALSSAALCRSQWVPPQHTRPLTCARRRLTTLGSLTQVKPYLKRHSFIT